MYYYVYCQTHASVRSPRCPSPSASACRGAQLPVPAENIQAQMEFTTHSVMQHLLSAAHYKQVARSAYPKRHVKLGLADIS